MTTRLFRRPGKIVFVDDDVMYLEMLSVMAPSQWTMQLFADPRQAIRFMEEALPAWDRDAWEQRRIASHAMAEPYGVIAAVLAYWRDNPQRFALPRTLVTDYSMPPMDGLAMLSKIGAWSGARVLLTGQADEHVAVRAFNDGLIDMYAPKQGSNVRAQVLQPIERLSERPIERLEQTWQGLLRPEQHALLREPAVQEALEAFSREHFVEHVILGQPFGMLGLSADGKPSWLQLETAATLEGAAEVAADAGVSEAAAQDIRAGRTVTALETGVQAAHERLLAPAIELAGGRVKAGLFPLWPDMKLPGLRQWIAERPKHAISR